MRSFTYFSIIVLLFALTSCGSPESDPRVGQNEAKLTHLEEKFSSLSNENAELKKEIAHLKQVVSEIQLSEAPATTKRPSSANTQVRQNQFNDRRKQHTQRQQVYMVMKAMVRKYSDEQIAENLNRRKLFDTKGKPWTAKNVSQAINKYQLDKLRETAKK